MELNRFRGKHAAGLALISLVCTLAVLTVYQLIPYVFRQVAGLRPAYRQAAAFRRAERNLTEWLQVHGRSATLPDNVVFLPIDDYSVDLSDVSAKEIAASPGLQAMQGGYPYLRAIYPLIIERLMRAGAKVVAFDILFPSAKAGDEAFAATLEKYRGRVIVGSNLTSSGSDRGETPELVLPSPSLLPRQESADIRVGYVNFKPDADDDRVRAAIFRTTLLEYCGKPPLEGAPELWSLAAQAARQAGLEALVPPGHRPHAIRFLRDVHPYSLHEIFIDRAWSNPPYRNGALFKDKIVFIGPYGNWVKDELETPFGLLIGPQIHLSALSALLNRDYLYDLPPAADTLVIVLAGVAAWLAGLGVHHPIRRGALLIGGAMLYVAVAFLVFNTTGWTLKLLGPNLTFLSSGFLGLMWERLRESKERQRVRRTLERYVSRDVVKEVLDNPQSYLNTLEGVSRKPITILFSDVRDFTTLTESADAAKLVRQLNEYLTEMVRIVFAHDGTLDKFMGDAVVASWGAVFSRGEAGDACRAVSAALDMLHAVQKLNARWKEQGLFQLKIGLGVNHGDAICGNIGSEEKREFTAIGDTVNLASRLEGATKEYHVDLLIGGSTAELVRESMTVRSVDLLQVKGKTKPVAVFTVMDRREGAPPPAWLPTYEEGVRLYRQRLFAEAERCFAQAVEGDPGDWLNREYLRRAQEYLAVAPAAHWDGVHVLTKK